MPSPASPDQPFPWEDDDPQPGITIRPLSHADLGALIAELRAADPDQPAQAVLERPRLGGQPVRQVGPHAGEPGASVKYRCCAPCACATRSWNGANCGYLTGAPAARQAMIRPPRWDCGDRSLGGPVPAPSR